MSTEHPLTDDQLDALVDELQDRLGDSTAQKYGRRGVLAALGVAALGTGSASAQASGAVGTASNPVDVFGYDVTAQNSFTDPAGVSHSGELADISDVGASGQWQEANSGSNIEPIDGETIGTGSEDVDVGTLSTEETNSVQIMRPGDDLQTKIDATPNGGVLQFVPGAYDPATIGVPGTIDRPIKIDMPGGMRGNDIRGAVIDNSGSSPVAGPMIEWTHNTNDFSEQINKATLCDSVNIIHEGSGPAIRIGDIGGTCVWNDINIDCQDSGDIGIRYDAGAGGVLNNPRIYRFADVALKCVNSTGGAHVLNDPWISAGAVATPTAGVEILSGQFKIESGTVATNNSGIGIDVDGGGALGDYCYLESNDIHVRVGETTTTSNLVDLRRLHFSISQTANFKFGTESKFNNIHANEVSVTPTYLGIAEGVGDVYESTYAGHRFTGSTSGYDDASAGRFKVGISPTPTVSDGERSNITYPKQGMRIYNNNANGYEYYNGSAWISGDDGTST